MQEWPHCKEQLKAKVRERLQGIMPHVLLCCCLQEHQKLVEHLTGQQSLLESSLAQCQQQNAALQAQLASAQADVAHLRQQLEVWQ